MPPSSQSIIFPSSAAEGDSMCLQFQIIGDDFKEADETFNVLLNTENSFDIVVGDVSQIPITIEDDMDRKSH